MPSRAIVFVAVFLLAACSPGSMRMPNRSDYEKLTTPHRIEIQQGNFISQEMVSQLKSGQTKEQVRFILGTPLIVDSFHADRWDYIFWRQRADSKVLEQRHIAVFFEDDVLKRIEGDVTPAASADPAAVKVPEAASAAARPAPAPQPLPPMAQPAKPAAVAPAPPVAAQSEQSGAKPAPGGQDAKQAAAQDKADATPDLPGAQKRDTRSWWERLKDKMSF